MQKFDYYTPTKVIFGKGREAEVGTEMKKDGAKKRAMDVFGRLLLAGERLMAVIRKNEGLSNKETARFTDQINALCDKWDR